MTGQYITSQREELPAMPTATSTWFAGNVPDKNSFRIVPATQVTRSWRTMAEGQDQQIQLENDLRIYRNGFSSSDPRFDRGHEFLTSKTRWWLSHRDYFAQGTYPQYGKFFIRGPLVPVFIVNTGVPSTMEGFNPYPELPSEADIVTMGQRAILNTAPTSPAVSLSTSVGELLGEGLPSIIGSSVLRNDLNVFRSFGGEYLNVKFGWAPFASDLKKTVISLKRASVAIAQLQRDSGRPVRRRFHFPDTVKSSEFSTGTDTTGPFMGWSRDFVQNSDGCWVNRIIRTERRAWFSGEYTYHVPRDDNLLGKMQAYEQKANILIGTRFTPDTLWNLMPWSWLLDWRLMIGDQLAALSLFQEDSLVMRYGYLMVKTNESHTYSSAPNLKVLGGGPIPVASVSFSRETKRRYRSTPYGFGVNEGSFTLAQIAILGALGLSRSPSVKF